MHMCVYRLCVCRHRLYMTILSLSLWMCTCIDNTVEIQFDALLVLNRIHGKHVFSFHTSTGLNQAGKSTTAEGFIL